MSNGRRTIDRRRRVLYSAHQADQQPATAASRREAARLREARCPPAAYGSRVHRRLRARWFSLVPVKRRTMLALSGVLALIALTLAFAHYASVAWPSLAYRGEIARPLRLDRPDSFGRWFMVAMLAGSSGVAFLIYQLRRYRNDDFKGRYRLWRLIVVLMLLASVNALVSIIDWGGALLDVGFGKRVALSGSDWVRLMVSLGGAMLALRLVAEVRRCRIALATMLLVCGLFAIPEAAKWNVMQVESLGRWALVTSAPMLGSAAFFVALCGYLRMLYREVKQIEESDSLRNRFEQMRLRVFHREPEDENRTEDESDNETRRRWWRRRKTSSDESVQRVEEEQEQEEEQDVESEEEEIVESSESDEDKPSKNRRGWFGRRRKENGNQNADQDDDPEAEEDSAESPRSTKKRGRFSMRLKPSPSAAQATTQEESNSDSGDEAADGAAAPKKKRGLGGWLNRKPKPATEDGDELSGEAAARPGDGNSPASDSGNINEDEIDWSSLSKAEKRRLRKQLKRQNRAA